MNARKLLVERIREALPNWRVIEYPVVPDALRDVAIIVYTSDIRRREQNRLVLEWDLQVWVAHGGEQTSRLEDKLDAALLDLLPELEAMREFTWSDVTRDVLADTYAGYRLTVTSAYTTT